MFIKYTKQSYLDAMLNQGKVRLSTFWHYQAHEQPEIGDLDEGQSGFIFKNDTNESWEITPDLLDKAAMSDEGAKRYFKSKVLAPGYESWIEGADGFNTFMYSLTDAEAPSKKLMEKLDYDCAIEICDIEEFANHTSKALRQFVIN